MAERMSKTYSSKKPWNGKPTDKMQVVSGLVYSSMKLFFTKMPAPSHKFYRHVLFFWIDVSIAKIDKLTQEK